mmetsp:Transcript_16956/g.45470  ORF Transcript_16956/g.45470 Transcript_16956/m.45470 type:complete len:242 (-) Transcript_16956:173-898(-)
MQRRVPQPYVLVHVLAVDELFRVADLVTFSNRDSNGVGVVFEIQRVEFVHPRLVAPNHLFAAALASFHHLPLRIIRTIAVLTIAALAPTIPIVLIILLILVLLHHLALLLPLLHLLLPRRLLIKRAQQLRVPTTHTLRTLAQRMPPVRAVLLGHHLVDHVEEHVLVHLLQRGLRRDGELAAGDVGVEGVVGVGDLVELLAGFGGVGVLVGVPLERELFVGAPHIQLRRVLGELQRVETFLD